MGGISEPKLKNVDIRCRAHIVSWAANQTLNIPGDFVECGVWYGILSKKILFI